MLYFCKRCGFETIQRANMRSHMQRQKPCEPKLNDIEYETIKEEFAYLMEKQPPGASKSNTCAQSASVFKCPHCDMSFKHKQSRHNHLKLNRCPVLLSGEKEMKVESLNGVAKPLSITDDNIYIYNRAFFGVNIYGHPSGGDIYIVQTDPSLDNYYKIGKTIDISQRMQAYRCGLVFEPRLHCWFPFRNVAEADQVLKRLLKPFNVKREIFTGELKAIVEIIQNLQFEFDRCRLSMSPTIKT